MSIQASIRLEELQVAGPPGMFAIHAPSRALDREEGQKLGSRFESRYRGHPINDSQRFIWDLATLKVDRRHEGLRKQ